MPIEISPTGLYTTQELEKTFGLNKDTIRGYVREKKFRGRKLGRKWYISGRSIIEFFKTGDDPEDLEDEDE